MVLPVAVALAWVELTTVVGDGVALTVLEAIGTDDEVGTAELTVIGVGALATGMVGLVAAQSVAETVTVDTTVTVTIPLVPMTTVGVTTASLVEVVGLAVTVGAAVSPRGGRVAIVDA
jgi:hypothetical protein